MKNKDLIAHLQQFDEDLEVWLFDQGNFEEWIPQLPTIHFEHIEHTQSTRREFICIPFAHKFDGN